jgi:hypothetical protein
VGAGVLVAALWLVLHMGWYVHREIVDWGLYRQYGVSTVDHGAVPYRDYQVEYPPAALPVFFVLAFFASSEYPRVFEVLMALCLLAIVLAVGRLAGWRAAAVVLLAPLALGSLVYSRFDLWPAALVAVGLLALLRERFVLAAVLVGTAFAAKLWPALLVPPIAVWLVRNYGRRVVARWLAAATATAVAWFAPFVVLAPGGIGYPFRDELARPLQIESLGGAVLIALHRTTGLALQVIDSYGSQNLSGPGAHAAAIASGVASATVVLFVWIVFARGPASEERLLVACAASVAAPIAFGKVFSPQFLIWLIALVPLLHGRLRWRVLALFAGALVLTQLWYPRHYWDMVAFRSPYISLVLARDLTLVALTVVLLVELTAEHPAHRDRDGGTDADLVRVGARAGGADRTMPG